MATELQKTIATISLELALVQVRAAHTFIPSLEDFGMEAPIVDALAQLDREMSDEEAEKAGL